MQNKKENLKKKTHSTKFEWEEGPGLHLSQLLPFSEILTLDMGFWSWLRFRSQLRFKLLWHAHSFSAGS